MHPSAFFLRSVTRHARIRTGNHRQPACPEHEHDTLTEAITAGDAARAHDLMREHLEHIEHSLDLHTTPTSALDLESIFKRA